MIADRKLLHDELIRLHIVANSDSYEDQRIKLFVRDAVISSINDSMSHVKDVDEARKWLQENIDIIQAVANETLINCGSSDSAIVSLCREAFAERSYETFSLPAGVYHSLRIKIGDAAGKNWWCVVFPTLCVPATSDEFEVTAAGAGFSPALNKALTGEGGYEIHFYLLNALGKLENIFFQE